MLNITCKGMIFSIMKYSLTDDKTGEVIRGCSVQYLVPRESKEDSAGYESLKCSVPIENYDVLKPYIGKSIELELKPNLKTSKFQIVRVDKDVLS